MAGRDPTDPRTLLAAERTLLAWLRTGLSLITFGFVIGRIGIWLRAQGAGELKRAGWMGALFGALGASANLMALLRYMAFRKAILSNSAAPTSAVALLCFAASVAVVGAMLSAVVFAQLF
jgi:putative membrane protein